ncbi:FAD-binding oxidoreductase [Actinomadura welshii]|uniref:FAD-binding oxidoreductase n=1 Tax=Actinomadura welshii TaxID=3103817 RepID=UPI0003AD3A2C|nr:FAD-binding oxidoreductase [Actinomadura madurae]
MSAGRLSTRLIDGFEGDLVGPDHPEYERLRRIWNGDIDRRPALIAMCRSAGDVALAIRHAREAGLVVAVRSGGHSYPGHSVCEGGVVIDLSNMNQVVFAEDGTTVHVGAGALLGTVDRATVARGRVVPAGIVSHTGFAGLALGGGMGYLTRSHGMTCDHLTGFTVVTADGEIVRADTDHHPDLFWALRGGGGNFGVVTEFECRTSPVPPLCVGHLFYPADRAVETFESVRDLVEAGTRALTVRLVSGMTAPGENGAHERDVVGVRVIYQGHPDDKALSELRQIGDPVLNDIRVSSYLRLQTEFDEFSQRGIGWYMKSGHTRKLTRDGLAAMIEATHSHQRVASDHVLRSVHSIASLGGAASDMPETATAYSGRDAGWHFAVEVGFTTEEERRRIVGNTRAAWAKIEPHLDMETSYVNMLFEEQLASMEKVYGTEKFTKLRRIKTTYDPANVFRHNANIPPLTEAERQSTPTR